MSSEEDEETSGERDNIKVTFDVQVVDSDGYSIDGAKVHAVFSENDIFSDLLKGGGHTEYTDSDGHATFECTMTHDSVVFFCRDKKFGPYNVDDGDSFTLSV